MKTGTVVLIGLAGLFAFHILGLGVAGAAAQVVFDGVQVVTPLNYLLTFTIQNVSNTSLQFKGMDGVVTLNGNNVGNVSSFPAAPITIPGPGQQKVNISLDLSALSLAADVMSFIQSPGNTLNFEVQGNLNVSSAIIPFDVTQQITV
jgi:hypothetical protein